MLHGHCAPKQHTVVDAPALHPLYREGKLFDLRLLLFVLLQLQVEARLLFLQIEGIIAVIVLRLAVCDFDDAVHDPVEEIPVMRDGQRGSFILFDIGFEPLYAVHIEMIRRLVEQKNIRFFQEQSGQIHPRLLAPGKHGEELIAHRVRNPKAVADLVHIRIHFIAAAHLIGVGEAVIFRKDCPIRRDGHLLLQGSHLFLHGEQIPIGRAKHVLHRVTHGIDRDLGDQADFAVRRKDNGALVRLQLPGEHAEERGLAAAVAAHDAHALPRQDLKGKPVQQDLADLKGFF